MLCPYCGKEMEQGYIKSSHPFLWNTVKDEGLLVRGKIRLSNSIFSGFWSGCSCEAYICRACGKLIADLPPEKKK